MKRQIFEILANRGIALSHRTDMGLVRALIGRMRPRSVELPLIRLGGDNDGGYLVPDDLSGIEACFSPGVDVTATFEQSLVNRGIPCYLADGSVAGAPIKHPLVHFEKKFLGVVEDENTTTLDQWVARCSPRAGDLLLQMDIEGSEWPVLLNVSDATLSRFRILVLELHFLEHMLGDFTFTVMSAMLDRLLRGFYVVHLHPNNLAQAVQVGGISIPRLLEITLLRRDRAEPTGFASAFPHPLDQPNMTDRPDVALAPEWYCPAI